MGGRGDGGKWTVHIPKVDRKLVLGQSQGEAWLAGSTHMHFFFVNLKAGRRRNYTRRRGKQVDRNQPETTETETILKWS